MYTQRHQFRSNVVPRFQWNNNSGYCGETSFICAGMSFGQYCSQWTARSLASPSIPQYDSGSQLLIGGGNDITAAKGMLLKAREYSIAEKQEAREFKSAKKHKTPHFINWVKRHLLAGHVPIIGVYNNVIALGEQEGGPGDPQYDHIVPVLGFESYWPLKSLNWPVDEYTVRYHSTDVITLSDNGLYGPTGDPARYPMLYSYEVAAFQGDRNAANNPEGAPVYMLSNTTANCGIAIEGVDHDGACIPVRLSSDRDYEPVPPTMKQPPPPPPPPLQLAQPPFSDQPPPEPIDIWLTATVERPGQNEAYTLYRYDDFAKVPVSDFHANADNAAQVWHVKAGSDPMVVTHKAKSSDTVVFRAVKGSPE